MFALDSEAALELSMAVSADVWKFLIELLLLTQSSSESELGGIGCSFNEADELESQCLGSDEE